MRDIASSRWSRRDRPTAAAMLAIAVLLSAASAGGLWFIASPPAALLRPAERRPGSVLTGVIYSWRGLLMQRSAATGRKSNDGLLVQQVEPYSPATKAKLKPGDIITAFDGITVNSARSLAMAIADHCCGPTVLLGLWRNHHFRNCELPPVTSASAGPPARTVERGGVG